MTSNCQLCPSQKLQAKVLKAPALQEASLSYLKLTSSLSMGPCQRSRNFIPLVQLMHIYIYIYEAPLGFRLTPCARKHPAIREKQQEKPCNWNLSLIEFSKQQLASLSTTPSSREDVSAHSCRLMRCHVSGNSRAGGGCSCEAWYLS